MRTNVMLDDALVSEAFSYARTIRTKKGLIDAALREFVNNRKRKNISELVGKIKFRDGYNYKTLRAGR